jgi:hypothetical protein
MNTKLSNTCSEDRVQRRCYYLKFYRKKILTTTTTAFTTGTVAYAAGTVKDTATATKAKLLPINDCSNISTKLNLYSINSSYGRIRIYRNNFSNGRNTM